MPSRTKIKPAQKTLQRERRAVKPADAITVNQRDKPDTCFTSGCPLASVGKGFVLDYGDPCTAQYAFMLEAPGSSEIMYSLTQHAGKLPDRVLLDERELERRRRDYPALPEVFRAKGAALVGASWNLLEGWVLRKFGIRREQLFIANTLRCLPPKQGRGADASHYPTGTTRKLAEACCRQYDLWPLYQPQLVLIGMHPASLMRSITPLPLLIHVVEKMRDAARQGLKPVLLTGGKAVKAWLGYFDSVTKHHGHYEWSTAPVTQWRPADLISATSLEATGNLFDQTPQNGILSVTAGGASAQHTSDDDRARGDDRMKKRWLFLEE